jgi:hypothetical protein
MKSILSYSLLAAAMAAGVAYGQATTATTTPVGYVSTTLKAQSFNLVGLTVHSSSASAGDLELSAGFGNVLTDADASFSPQSGRLYILEITSGTLKGTIQEVPSASIAAKTITTTDNLEALGLANGDRFTLRLAPTLEEIFTTNTLTSGGTLYASLNSGNADNVWLPDGSGGYNKYYLRNGAFYNVATNQVAPNTPIVYADGLWVEKKVAASTDVNLVISGEVKTVGTNSVISQGFTVLGVVAPAGLTLKTSGLENSLYPSLNAGNADKVWVPQADGTFKRYYRRGSAWRDFDAQSADLPAGTDPALNGAILIERTAAAAGTSNLKLEVPASYSGL